MDALINCFEKIVYEGDTAPVSPPTIVVGAFGKHPSESDHLRGINLETAPLVTFKKIAYDGAFELHTPIWQRLEAEGQSIPWGHLYVHRHGSDILLARLWPSSDALGRSKYPMALCAHGKDVTLDWMLINALPRLIEGESSLRSAVTSAEVSNIIAKVGRDLQSQARRGRFDDDGHWIAAGFDAVAQCEKLGVEGVLRVGGSICEWIDPENRANIGRPMSARPSLQFRVPLCASDLAAAVRAWCGFAISMIGQDTPLRLICPDHGDWLDLIVGDAGERTFGCFRAGDAVIRPVTHNPSPLDLKRRQFAVHALDRIHSAVAGCAAQPGAQALLPWQKSPIISSSSPADHKDPSAFASFADVADQEEWDLHGEEAESESSGARKQGLLVLMGGLITIFLIGLGIWRQASAKPAPYDVPNLHEKWNTDRIAELSDQQAVLEKYKQVRRSAASAFGVEFNDVTSWDDAWKVADKCRADAAEAANSPSTNVAQVKALRKKADDKINDAKNAISSAPQEVISQFDGVGTNSLPVFARQFWKHELKDMKGRLTPFVPTIQSLHDLDQMLQKLAEDRRQLSKIPNAKWDDFPEEILREVKQPAPRGSIAAALKDWYVREQGKQPATQAASLEPATIEQLVSLQRETNERPSNAKKRAEEIWNYWCKIDDAIGHPCNTPSIVDALKRVSPEPEAKDIADQVGGVLKEERDQILSLPAAVPASFFDGHNQKQPIVVLAAWQCFAGSKDPNAWTTVDLSLDKKIFETIDNAIGKLNCPAISTSVDDVKRKRWHDLVSNPDAAFLAKTIESKAFYKITDETESNGDPRVSYNLAVFKFNKLLATKSTISPDYLKSLQGIAQAAAKVASPSDQKKINDWIASFPPTSPAAANNRIGPEKKGWTATKDKEFILFKSGYAEITFQHISPDSRISKLPPYYLCTTELSVGVLQEIANNNPEVLKAIRADSGDPEVPHELCAWRINREGNVEIQPEWNAPELKDWTNLLREKPSANSPATRIKAVNATKVAEAIFCRLPSEDEWKYAYDQYGKQDDGKANLRNGEFQRYRTARKQAKLGLPPLQLNELFFPSSNWLEVGKDEKVGFAFFREVPIGPGARAFHDMVGNVAEWVKDSDQYKVIGLSAFDNRGDPVGKDKKHSDTVYAVLDIEKKLFVDVGMRLAIPDEAIPPPSAPSFREGPYLLRAK